MQRNGRINFVATGLVLILVCLFITNPVLSQNDPPEESSAKGLSAQSKGMDAKHDTPSTLKGYISPLTFRENVLSIAVLFFGLLIMLLDHWLLRKNSSNIGPDSILLLDTVILIIIGTLFLVTSGYSDKQIAPAMGLFGTIIGYVLGRRSDNKRGGFLSEHHEREQK